MPKPLLPTSSSVGTISPISGPATYQGQGRVRRSSMRRREAERPDYRPGAERRSTHASTV